MAIVDLFSKRQARLRGELPDVYVYDEVPHAVRVQIVHILRDIAGKDFYRSDSFTNIFAQHVHDALCREYGLLVIKYPTRTAWYPSLAIEHFVLNEATVEQVLDLVEFAFHTAGSHYAMRARVDAAIEELNHRLQEQGVGYQIVGDQVIRLDSTHLHQEVMRPALAFLSQPGFEGANQEMLSAHDHYRHGRYKEGMNECLKAFESTMKVICAKRGWAHPQNATANQLVSVCLEGGLIPQPVQAGLTAFRATLESAIPTPRNRMSGHGQGAAPVEVPQHIARYLLHITASTILMLAEADSALG